MKTAEEWKVYRTRFLVRARQLSGPFTFTDSLGRHHLGGVGDYIVESSDGTKRIAPKAIFEDIYVPIEQPRRGGRPVDNRIGMQHPTS